MTPPYHDPGTPDLRSPLHFMGWVGRGQWRTLAGGIVFGVIWMVAQALLPAALSRAVDEGLIAGDQGSLWAWSGAVIGLALVVAGSGAIRHWFAVQNWLRSSFRAVQLVGWKAADTGAALPRTVPTGEVVATVANDAMRLGGLYDVSARFAGAIVSYVVVAVILLRASTELGLLVLLGVPVLLASLSVIVKPLQKRQARQREESGKLVGLGADTVAGLRVLRGIGGERAFLDRYAAQSQRVRRVGVQVAGVQAALDASHVLLPGIFVLIVTWIGAHFAIEGQVSPGMLVAFYGYSAFLVKPLGTATEFVDRYTRARIAAGKLITVLSVPPDQVDAVVEAHAEGGTSDEVRLPPGPAELVDPVSGVQVAPGLLTAVVTARPEDAVVVADRLGRFGPEPTAARLGGVALAEVPIAQVRERILVGDNDPRLFTGPLRRELDPGERHSDADLLATLAVCSAEDVLDALPDGLDSTVEERGRSFSGGQRQRLGLARALLADADILVLVEPTSAVDAHTEARIAARLAAHRAGRTTVLMTASPLLLDHADHVVFLDGGVVVAEGSHHRLLRSCPAYRSTVTRGEDD
ncbi:MAG TPA: ABC transporter ATP-binding protein [Dermatophilaceae bacterium]|nr:ABC transporter ATP-binding protein [Dermatophilaceae bacterium]